MVSDPIDPASFSDVYGRLEPGQLRHDGLVLAGDDRRQRNRDDHGHRHRAAARNTTLTNTATASSSTPTRTRVTTPPRRRHRPRHRRPVDRQDRPANPIAGGADSYTLTVSNNGPDSAQGVVVNDTLPSQFTASAASGPGSRARARRRRRDRRVHAPTLTTAASPVRSRSPARSRRNAAGQTIHDAATVTSNTAIPT